MTAIIFLIEQGAIALYIFIGAGILWNLYQYFAHRASFRATYFELERDIIRFKQANALTAVVLLVELAIVVLGVQLVVAPTLRQDEMIQERISQIVLEDVPFRTPTPAPAFEDISIEPVPPIGGEGFDAVVRPTPTLTPTPVGTIIPNAPASVGCTSESVRLQIPTNGMRVFQPITIMGTAYTDNFAYAKIEIAGPSTFGSFAVLEDRPSPVRELSAFSQFVPAGYTEGWYQFRLAVFDITNTLRDLCMVNIYITEPFPTATPLGQ